MQNDFSSLIGKHIVTKHWLNDYLGWTDGKIIKIEKDKDNPKEYHIHTEKNNEHNNDHVVLSHDQMVMLLKNGVVPNNDPTSNTGKYARMGA